MKTFRLLALIFLIGATFLASCTDFFAKVEKHRDWDVYEQGRVVLHVRPEGYTQTRSPDDYAIDMILANQNFYFSTIKDYLGLSYNDQVFIYLFNVDEAYFSIGTQNGGHAVSDRSVIYYSYIQPEYRDRFGRKAFIGPHELVHVITHNTLGRPFTKMMSEGYAVALEGGYGRTESPSGQVIVRSVIDWMLQHYQSGNLLSPEDLLTRTDIVDAVYYPNAGLFVGYLWDRFGVNTINKLFNVSQADFRVNFQKYTGVKWDELSQEYVAWCDMLLESE